jgi:hypothetical protein
MYQVTTIAGGSFSAMPHAAAVRGRRVSDLPTTDDPDTVANPLLAIMVGMACFFGVAALIVGWG